jgi:hypothetical protein
MGAVSTWPCVSLMQRQQSLAAGRGGGGRPRRKLLPLCGRQTHTLCKSKHTGAHHQTRHQTHLEHKHRRCARTRPTPPASWTSSPSTRQMTTSGACSGAREWCVELRAPRDMHWRRDAGDGVGARLDAGWPQQHLPLPAQGSCRAPPPLRHALPPAPLPPSGGAMLTPAAPATGRHHRRAGWCMTPRAALWCTASPPRKRPTSCARWGCRCAALAAGRCVSRALVASAASCPGRMHRGSAALQQTHPHTTPRHTPHTTHHTAMPCHAPTSAHNQPGAPPAARQGRHPLHRHARRPHAALPRPTGALCCGLAVGRKNSRMHAAAAGVRRNRPHALLP